MATTRALVLASGGIESTTLLFQLAKEKKRFSGIIFDLDVASSLRQLHYSKKALRNLNSSWEIVDLRGTQRMLAGIMDPEFLPEEGDCWCPVDLSFIPIFVNISTYYAQSLKIGEVYIGLTKEQMRTNTKKFLEMMAKTMTLYQDAPSVKILAPFSDIEKSGVINLAYKLGVDLKETWSCFRAEDKHCGRCPACLSRRTAFKSSRHEDPTEYMS